MKTVIIKHIDGKTDVKANVLMFGNSINLEYKFKGMTYGRELSLIESYELGIIECEHPRERRDYIGSNLLRCNICGKEFS